MRSNVAVRVKLDVEATKKMLAESLAELEPTPYEDIEARLRVHAGALVQLSLPLTVIAGPRR